MSYFFPFLSTDHKKTKNTNYFSTNSTASIDNSKNNKKKEKK